MIYKNRFNESKVTPCSDWSGYSEGIQFFHDEEAFTSLLYYSFSVGFKIELTINDSAQVCKGLDLLNRCAIDYKIVTCRIVSGITENQFFSFTYVENKFIMLKPVN